MTPIFSHRCPGRDYKETAATDLLLVKSFVVGRSCSACRSMALEVAARTSEGHPIEVYDILGGWNWKGLPPDTAVLKAENDALRVENESLRAGNESLKDENLYWKIENRRLVGEFGGLKEEIERLNSENGDLKAEIERLKAGDNPDLERKLAAIEEAKKGFFSAIDRTGYLANLGLDELIRDDRYPKTARTKIRTKSK